MPCLVFVHDTLGQWLRAAGMCVKSVGERAIVTPMPALFDIFGERIVVHTTDLETRERIGAALAAYATSDNHGPCAEFHIERGDGISPFHAGQLFSSRTLLVVGDNHKLITASLGALPWQLHIQAYQRSAEYVYGYLFDPLLLMVLKRRDLVHCHAAAVDSGRGAILIVGGSGAGKSTTTLSLLLHGYRFIADDELFLHTRPDGVYARGGERFSHLTEATAALLAGLPDTASLPLVQRGTRMKRRLDVAFFGEMPATAHSQASGAIRLVLFPRVDVEGATRVEPVDVADTMRRLLLHRPKEHPAVIPDAPSIERQFATCAALATSAPAFDLILGRDIARLPHVVDEVIA